VKLRLLLTALAALLTPPAAHAVDHNNVDEGRPLSFDDADTVAFRERATEGGLLLRVPQGAPLGLQADLELLYGFALNSQVSLSVSPSVGGRAGSSRTSFDVGDVAVGALHSFRREIGNTPAVAVRGDLFLPTGRDSHGLGFRLRGILSKTATQYDRFHLNLDLSVKPSARANEREFSPALILGYTRPVGYPRQFTRTALAEVGVQAGSRKGTGPLILAGVGLRQQVTVRSVFDLGLESDIVGFDGAPRDPLRLIAGYSVGY
jgi:Putative MetA-pathway of phenol degradation